MPVRLRQLCALTLMALPVGAQQVVPARPVEEPTPGAPPIAPARPVEEAEARPDEDFLQANPANDLLAFAEMLYKRGDYQSALQRFEEFMRLHPRHEGARKALYLGAECLRKLGRDAEAENLFALVVDRYRRGEYVDAAAYRAAAMAYNRRDYRSAHPYFAVARATTDKPELKLDATYRAARSLQILGETRKAIPLYREVANTDGPNGFRESARLALGRLSLEAGKEEEALESFTLLAEGADDPVVRGESLVRAGLLLAKNERQEEAERAFAKVFSIEGADAWKPVAQFGLIQSRYRAKDYAGVIDAYQRGAFKLSDEMRAQMFLMVGNAFQRTEDFESAVKVYGMLENFYRDKPEGLEAGYRRLECLYRQEDENLPDFVDHYIKTQTAAGQDHGFLDRARLLKAEVLFSRLNATAAAQAYAAIRVANLPENQRAGVLYKTAWAQAEAQQRPQAIETLTTFLTRHPNDSRRALALARRGELFRLNGDRVAAMRDFETVLDRHAKSSAAEFAYQQAALIAAEQNDTQAVIKLNENLLEDFPETKAAPEARYALGRAYYKVREYPKARENLRMARDLDPATYARPAGSRIVLACYAMKDAEALREELDLFLQEGKAGSLPPQVPAWLGVKLYEEGDAGAAAHYLGLAADEESPAATEPVIWKYLGKARLDAGDYAEAITAIDYYLATAESAGVRANALLDKARAQYGMGRFDDAEDTAVEGQKIVRQGKTNAWLLILRGDIALATGDHDQAVKHYAVPSQTIIDPEITPLALWKTSQALLKGGRRDEAKQFRDELRAKYPAFKPLPENLPPRASVEDPAERRPETTPEPPTDPEDDPPTPPRRPPPSPGGGVGPEDEKPILPGLPGAEEEALPPAPLPADAPSPAEAPPEP